MTCSVNFSGNWVPVMKWQREGDDVIAGVSNVTVPYTSVTYSLKVPAVGTRLRGGSYNCTTYFSAGNKPPGVRATNIPNYEMTWSSPEISIICELLLQLFSSAKASSYQVGMKHLVCLKVRCILFLFSVVITTFSFREYYII